MYAELRAEYLQRAEELEALRRRIIEEAEAYEKQQRDGLLNGSEPELITIFERNLFSELPNPSTYTRLNTIITGTKFSSYFKVELQEMSGCQKIDHGRKFLEMDLYVVSVIEPVEKYYNPSYWQFWWHPLDFKEESGMKYTLQNVLTYMDADFINKRLK